MREALTRAELPLEGTHHRGRDDAWSLVLSKVEGIAALLCTLLRGIQGSSTYLVFTLVF